MKLLFTEGVGAAQTTTNAQDEKIKIFASESDMLDNIDTLNENEIVATNDATEADLIGNMLSEIAALKEKLALSTTPDWENAVTYNATTTLQSFTAPSKGFIVFDLSGSSGGNATIIVNDVVIFDRKANVTSFVFSCTGSVPVGKGDTIQYKTGSDGSAWKGTEEVIFVPYKGE